MTIYYHNGSVRARGEEPYEGRSLDECRSRVRAVQPRLERRGLFLWGAVAHDSDKGVIIIAEGTPPNRLT